MPEPQQSFNLIDEPWVRVRWLDGRVTCVSLDELFAHASEIRHIAGELPTQDFAVLRVLLAILQRTVVTDEDLSEDARPTHVWAGLWQASGLPVDKIRRYLAQWHHRFNLFDDEMPFMQVSGLHAYNPNNDEGGGLSRLIADFPNRPERALFTTRSGDGIAQLTYAEAARWLVHAQAYDTGNNKSRASGDGVASTNPRGVAGTNTGWAGKIGGVYVTGHSLRDVLLLNLVLTSPSDKYLLPDEDDIPCWEDAPMKATYATRLPRGRADLYTWQARRMLLRRDGDLVTNVLLCPGDISSDTNTQRFEAMSAWKENAKGDYRPLRHQVGRALWRSLPALLPQSLSQGRKTYREPEVLLWLERLAYESEPPALTPDSHFVLHATGVQYVSQQNAAFGDIVDDAVILPTMLLDSRQSGLFDLVSQCIADTDAAVAALRRLSLNLEVASGLDESGLSIEQRTQKTASLSDGAYFALGNAFRQWLAALEPVEDDSNSEHYCENRRLAWRSTAYSLLTKMGERIVRGSGPQAFAGHPRVGQSDWMTSGKAERIFRISLRKALDLADTSPAPVVSDEKE